MKNLYLALIVLLVLACQPEKHDKSFNFSPLSSEDIRLLEMDNLKSSTESEGNPFARADFDILRFRDPATGQIPEGIRTRELAFAKTIPVSDGYSVKSNGITRNITALFTPAGPENVGGRSRAIAIDVSNENILFAGGVSGGLWRSANLGQSWTRVSDITDLPNIRYIHQDRRSGRTNEWYYSTGEILPGSSAGAIGAPYRGNGIFKSVNGGLSWDIIPSTATGGIENPTSPFNYVHNIAQDFSNNAQTEVYAAAIGGIYRSVNGFTTNEIVVGHNNINTNNDGIWTEVAVTSTGVVYATISNFLGQDAGETGIFRSETGTAGSFVNITPPDFFSTYRRTVIGIDPSNESIVYFLANNGDADQFFKYDASQPAGSEWTNLTTSLPSFGGLVGDYEAQGSYNMLLRVHPDNSNVVYIGGTNLYRSTNAFADDTQTQWVGGYSRSNNTQDYFGSHADMHNLIFFPSDGTRSLSSHDGGISITDDNLKTTETDIVDQDDEVVQRVIIEWEALNNGYTTSQFYGLSIDPMNVGNPTLLGGMQDNSTYITQDFNRETNWFNIGTGDGGFSFYDLESVVISAQLANMFRLENGGGFATISPPNVGNDDLFLFINPFYSDPVSPSKIFVGTQGKLFYTLNIGLNPEDDEWFSFGSSAIPSSQRVSAMGGSIEPQSILYVGTESGTLLKIDNSTALDRIENVTGNQFPGNAYISSISVDPRDGNHVVVTFSNYNVTNVFATTNGGQSWTAVQGNLSAAGQAAGGAPSARWVTIMPNGDNNTLYLLGTSVGLFSTTNLQGNSTVWEREAVSTIGTTPIDMIATRTLDGYVAVATHGNGIFEANLDFPLQATLQLLDVRCDQGEALLQTNIAFNSQNDFDLDYEWFVNGQSQGANLNTPTIGTDQEARYQVRVTNTLTGQSDLSNEVILDFSEANDLWCSGNPIASIEDELAEGLLLYPNPVRDVLSIKHQMRGETTVQIFGIGGELMFETSSISPTMEVDMSMYVPGPYIVVISDNEKKISKRVIKI